MKMLIIFFFASIISISKASYQEANERSSFLLNKYNSDLDLIEAEIKQIMKDFDYSIIFKKFSNQYNSISYILKLKSILYKLEDSKDFFIKKISYELLENQLYVIVYRYHSLQNKAKSVIYKIRQKTKRERERERQKEDKTNDLLKDYEMNINAREIKTLQMQLLKTLTHRMLIDLRKGF